MALSPGSQANRIGEVIEASTTEFVAQCYRLYEAPSLGALVRTGIDVPTYGVVSNISTQSIDPGRSPIARGEEEETEEGVYLSNPQLSRLMRTNFDSLLVGFRDADTPRYFLPPLPPRIHSFVYVCSPEEVFAFTRSLDFLPLLLDSSNSTRDQAVAAFLRETGECHPQPKEFLIGAGRQVSLLLGGQLQRLNAILKRLAV